eukprot:scaffold1190_cov393-Prasinococcus_capsulatus_cf.AAC.34
MKSEAANRGPLVVASPLSCKVLLKDGKSPPARHSRAAGVKQLAGRPPLLPCEGVDICEATAERAVCVSAPVRQPAIARCIGPRERKGQSAPDRGARRGALPAPRGGRAGRAEAVTNRSRDPLRRAALRPPSRRRSPAAHHLSVGRWAGRVTGCAAGGRCPSSGRGGASGHYVEEGQRAGLAHCRRRGLHIRSAPAALPPPGAAAACPPFRGSDGLRLSLRDDVPALTERSFGPNNRLASCSGGRGSQPFLSRLYPLQLSSQCTWRAWLTTGAEAAEEFRRRLEEKTENEVSEIVEESHARRVSEAPDSQGEGESDEELLETNEDKKECVLFFPLRTSELKLPAVTVRCRPCRWGGPRGLEPTRYGDWERSGRCVDF